MMRPFSFTLPVKLKETGSKASDVFRHSGEKVKVQANYNHDDDFRTYGMLNSSSSSASLSTY